LEKTGGNHKKEKEKKIMRNGDEGKGRREKQKRKGEE
jgi:hypothetical protein